MAAAAGGGVLDQHLVERVDRPGEDGIEDSGSGFSMVGQVTEERETQRLRAKHVEPQPLWLCFASFPLDLWESVARIGDGFITEKLMLGAGPLGKPRPEQSRVPIASDVTPGRQVQHDLAPPRLKPSV
jgi:hypothetical protein